MQSDPHLHAIERACPFCSSFELYLAAIGGQWRVCCENCEMQGPPLDTAELAVLRWNMLPRPPLWCRLGFHETRFFNGFHRVCIRCGCQVRLYSCSS